jgi:CheY-like chemotaxis protein
LPITDVEEETSTNSTPAPASVHGRILVAEDEDMVLEVVRRLLEEAGHDVVSARDGLEAVEQFRVHGGEFDLLLFDVVMPRLDGWRAYERIRAAAPDVRILFSSGYAAATLPNGLSAGPRIVAKPYEPETLLAAVAEVLRTK